MLDRLLIEDHINVNMRVRVCPEELENVISSLIYASSRIGELPELLDVRSMFAVRFGHAFVSAAVSSSKDFDERAKVLMSVCTSLSINLSLLPTGHTIHIGYHGVDFKKQK